jgi:hypothetical protein
LVAPVSAAHGHQLWLVLAAQQVVLILHGHEPGPAACLGGALQSSRRVKRLMARPTASSEVPAW